MTRFGLFKFGDKTPVQVIEGDYLEQAGDIVKVIKKTTNSTINRQVGAFNLDKDQVVREVKE